MRLEEFTPYVLPRAPGCSIELAEHYIRLALIELCRKARLWREYQPAIKTVDGITGYAYTTSGEQQVIELLSLTLASQDVDVVEPAIGKHRDKNGWVCAYAYGGLAGFELRPAQAAGLDIVTYCVLAPTITADEVPDEFAKYAEEIGWGALSRLLRMSNKPFTDKAGADDADAYWKDAIGSAATDASTGAAAVARRTTPHWF